MTCENPGCKKLISSSCSRSSCISSFCISTVSIQRPCLRPTPDSRPAWVKPNRRCSAADASLPVSAMTAMTCRAPAAAHPASSEPSRALPIPRPVQPGERNTLSSTVCR